jgi:deoxyribodipyrimidine photo-lyase
MRTLFWFRHDLRLADNTGFHAACRAGEVVPCVVLNDAYLRNSAIGPNRCALFLRAVADLAASLERRGARLIVRRGRPEDEIPRLLKDSKADAVFVNRDYDSYARARDERVAASVRAGGAAFSSFKDLVIFEADEVLTQAGRPYTIFTQYKKSWLSQLARPAVLPAPKRIPSPAKELAAIASVPLPVGEFLPESAVPVVTEKSARLRLREFLGDGILRYADERDLPARDGTSRLSPHLKFGTISARTVLQGAMEVLNGSRRSVSRRNVETFIGELIWRDFFFAVLAAFPHVETGAFRRQYDGIKWERNAELLATWQAGRTGFPIVDAGMRQLAATGWMHNRVRMIVASFLCKDLLLDWRDGERHFSRLLIDGEPALNNGNWQWSAGTGTDAQPFFRIFNPVSQSQRFDPAGEYIKRWVPELASVPAKHIHAPWEVPELCPQYPPPCVHHAKQRARALAMYKAARANPKSSIANRQSPIPNRLTSPS